MTTLAADKTRLSWEQVRWTCDPTSLDFKSTEEIFVKVLNSRSLFRLLIENRFDKDEADKATKLAEELFKLNRNLDDGRQNNEDGARLLAKRDLARDCLDDFS